AVSAKMGVGVEFAEQPRTSVTADLYAQRSGAGRAGEPERLDVLDLDPKLVVQRPADRRSTGAADIQVGAASPPVDDRKGLARREPSEADERGRDTDHDADRDV